MDTVVTSMTSTESQLKELGTALKLQQIAEKEAQEKLHKKLLLKTSRASC